MSYRQQQEQQEQQEHQEWLESLEKALADNNEQAMRDMAAKLKGYMDDAINR